MSDTDGTTPAPNPSPVPMAPPAPPERIGHLLRRVTDSDTARAVGSGSLDVLGTPVLLAWCEAATVQAVAEDLAAGMTTVGTKVEVSHLRPSAVGSEVAVTARLTRNEGRAYTFEVVATCNGVSIATGRIERASVNVDSFMGRLTRA